MRPHRPTNTPQNRTPTHTTHTHNQVEAAGLCYQAGIHAANHALLAVTPLFLKTDPGDIETEHTFPYQVKIYICINMCCVYIRGMIMYTFTPPFISQSSHSHQIQTPPKKRRIAPGPRGF